MNEVMCLPVLYDEAVLTYWLLKAETLHTVKYLRKFLKYERKLDYRNDIFRVWRTAPGILSEFCKATL